MNGRVRCGEVAFLALDQVRLKLGSAAGSSFTELGTLSAQFVRISKRGEKSVEVEADDRARVVGKVRVGVHHEHPARGRPTPTSDAALIGRALARVGTARAAGVGDARVEQHPVGNSQPVVWWIHTRTARLGVAASEQPDAQQQRGETKAPNAAQHPTPTAKRLEARWRLWGSGPPREPCRPCAHGPEATRLGA